MTTRAKREELRKDIARAGRGELLQLLLEAWAQLDVAAAIDEQATADAMNEETLEAIFGDDS